MAARQGQRNLLYTRGPDHLSQAEWSDRMVLRVEGSRSVGSKSIRGTTCQPVM